jgi:phage terminase large subunit-like protein
LSHGPRAAQIAQLMGLDLMPWQRQVLDTALEINPDTGRLAYREVRLTVPRQQGKSTLLLAVMAHRCIAMGDNQRIVATAQTAKDARNKWEDDYLPRIQKSPLGKLIHVRRQNGSEAIKWQNGSLWSLMASSEKSGHGATLDLAVLDEAFAQIDNRVEQSVKPAMMTRPEPQFWVVSTAGTTDSVYLNQKVDDGRERAEKGQTTGVCYFEWSADPDADPLDPETWLTCMPALGHTVSVETIEADQHTMPLSEFRRAYLNQRIDRRHSDPVIDIDTWRKAVDERSQLVGDVVFAVDVTPDRSAASIAVAGRRADGKRHVEVISAKPDVRWVADELVRLVERWSPVAVVLDPSGPAGGLLPALHERGIEPGLINARSMGQACALFYDLLHEGEVKHLGQPMLDSAVGGARRRRMRDAWAWSRDSVSVDISPLVAVTLALWGFDQSLSILNAPDEPVPVAIVSLSDL